MSGELGVGYEPGNDESGNLEVLGAISAVRGIRPRSAMVSSSIFSFHRQIFLLGLVDNGISGYILNVRVYQHDDFPMR